eukprot:7733856-Pyramimonas_sp.AAC.3
MQLLRNGGCSRLNDLVLGLVMQFHAALVVASVYVFAQTFAIPGTLTLSLLSGALFGFYKGIALVVGKLS